VRRTLTTEGADRSTPEAAIAAETLAMFSGTQDQGPTSLLLLAIRAARRAIQANPSDDAAYTLLGDAYVRLGTATSERAAGVHWFKLSRLRRVQAIAAYTEALRQNPSANAARLGLATIYIGMRMPEPALQNLSDYTARAARAGPQRDET